MSEAQVSRKNACGSSHQSLQRSRLCALVQLCSFFRWVEGRAACACKGLMSAKIVLAVAAWCRVQRQRGPKHEIWAEKYGRKWSRYDQFDLISKRNGDLAVRRRGTYSFTCRHVYPFGGGRKCCNNSAHRQSCGARKRAGVCGHCVRWKIPSFYTNFIYCCSVLEGVSPRLSIYRLDCWTRCSGERVCLHTACGTPPPPRVFHHYFPIKGAVFLSRNR